MRTLVLLMLLMLPMLLGGDSYLLRDPFYVVQWLVHTPQD